MRYRKPRQPTAAALARLHSYVNGRAIFERRVARVWLATYIFLAALATFSAGGAGLAAVQGTPSQSAVESTTNATGPSTSGSVVSTSSTAVSAGAQSQSSVATSSETSAPPAEQIAASSTAAEGDGDELDLVPILALIGAVAVGISTTLNPGHGWKAADQRAKDLESLTREVRVTRAVDLEGTFKEDTERRESLEYVLGRLDGILGSTPGNTSMWAAYVTDMGKKKIEDDKRPGRVRSFNRRR